MMVQKTVLIKIVSVLKVDRLTCKSNLQKLHRLIQKKFKLLKMEITNHPIVLQKMTNKMTNNSFQTIRSHFNHNMSSKLLSRKLL